MSKRFAEYFDSGAPWISDVESLSGMTRLKHVSTVQTGVTLSGEGNPVDPEWPYLRVANVQVGYVDMREIKTVRVPLDRAAASMLQPGDVLMTEGGDIDKLGRGALWRGKVPDMLHQNHIFAVRPSEALDSEFFVYWLDGSVARTYFRTTAKQTTNLAGTNKWTLGNLPVPVPPLAEQRAIADYLDRETARIDTLIEEQQRLIEMLRERRTAVVDAALAHLSSRTRTALKHMLSGIDQGVSPQAEAGLADEPGTWGVLKTGCVNRGVFRPEEHKRLPTDFTFDPSIAVEVGDVIVSRASGSPDLVGSAAIVEHLDYQLILSDKLFRLRPKRSVAPRFLAWSLNSGGYRVQVRRAISGAEGLANNLPLSKLRAFEMCHPSLDEQRRIAAYLDEQTAKVDTLIAETARFIELAGERRTALITAAVTGQIDVREMV